MDPASVARRDLGKLCDLIDANDAVAEEVKWATAQLASRPFGESTQRLTRAVAEWASATSKRVAVVVEGREEPVPPRLGEILSGVLGHLARNAVAHGIELPGEREARGKASDAALRLSCTRVTGGVRIVVEDDGAGLDEVKLRAAARDAGLDVDSDLSTLLFSPGLSTAADASEIAGRGMGMSAVRREIEAVGYTVEVMTKAGAGTRVEIRPGSMVMPANDRTSWRVA